MKVAFNICTLVCLVLLIIGVFSAVSVLEDIRAEIDNNFTIQQIQQEQQQQGQQARPVP